MPEGDTLHRIAAMLGPALEGQRVDALRLPRGPGGAEGVVGKAVERVEARGKNLLIHFSGGRVLHTHLMMNGVWHLYRAGERWRRGPATARVVLEAGGHVAVCFSAPVVRLLSRSALRDDPRLANVGPDLLSPHFDLEGALRRLRSLPDVALGEAIVDQRAVAGIGNVFKSELLFARRLDPFAPVSAFSEQELRALLELAREQLARNVAPREPPSTPPDSPVSAYRYRRRTRGRESDLDPGPPLAVYGRSQRPCLECGRAVRMERQASGRSTYYCPRCQPRRE